MAGTGFNWAGAGSILQGAGAIYGAYNTNKMSKKLYNLQKSFYKDEQKRKKKSQARLDYASSSIFGHRDDNARLPYNS
jgi:hypothetical protein